MSARPSPFFVRKTALFFGASFAIACTSGKAVTPPSVSSAEPVASTSASAAAEPRVDAAVLATSARSAACVARRPFVSASDPASERLLVLPAPFQTFDACAALGTLFPDYDRDTERSAQAGGIIRVRDAGLFLHGGRELLVVIDYRGKEAEEEMVAGCDPLHAHVSLLARSVDGKQLVVLARASEPLTHAGVGSAIGVGSSLALRENDPALVLRSELGCGTAPARTAAHVLVLDGAILRSVLGTFVGARGMQRDNEIHEIAGRLVPKPDRRANKDGFADLTLAWTDAPCPFDANGGPDKTGDYVCGRGKPLGTDTYRYDGRVYVRRGAATKVPFL